MQVVNKGGIRMATNRKAKRAVYGAHYATAYLATEGNLDDGLKVHGRTMTIETKSDTGWFTTQVSLNETKKVVLLACYMQKKKGNATYPLYRLKDICIDVYEPGEWEEILEGVEDYAFRMRERYIHYAYRRHRY